MSRAQVRELAVVVLKLVAVTVAVAAIVFGLIVVLYDHGGPPARAAVTWSAP